MKPETVQWWRSKRWRSWLIHALRDLHHQLCISQEFRFTLSWTFSSLGVLPQYPWVEYHFHPQKSINFCSWATHPAYFYQSSEWEELPLALFHHEVTFICRQIWILKAIWLVAALVQPWAWKHSWNCFEHWACKSTWTLLQPHRWGVHSQVHKEVASRRSWGGCDEELQFKRQQ